MVFSSIEFLFFFLPAVLLAYHASPRRWRNTLLAIASLSFYTYGGGALVSLLLISTLVDFSAARIVGRARQTGDLNRARLGLALSITVNLGLLGYFKYAGFLVEQFNVIGQLLGIGDIARVSIALPIGISFYTFQSMSYTIDVWRGRVEPLNRIRDFALYVSLFPQLIAGPIVRFHEVATQITDRRSTINDFAGGALRFSHGLIKKVIIADSVAPIADAAFGAGTLTTGDAWLGIAAYTLQIYFDFSGYSDMAIGLGMMFGFAFPENFNRPYSALSITDFWRRWHITLSNWFRDYLYIPLGGNREGRAKTYRNLVIVFFLTGLWHGAAWTFVVWGAYHGALLVIERATGLRKTDDSGISAALRRATTLLLVVIGWVLFRSASLSQAAGYLSAMFSVKGSGLSPMLELALTPRSTITLVLALSVVFLPRDLVFGKLILLDRRTGWALARAVTMAIGLPYALTLVASGSFSPFLYYQF